MGEMTGRTITEPGGVSADASQVLAWLGTAEAEALARRQLQRSGFGGHGDLVRDVVADAQLGVLTRMRSVTPFPEVVAAAYGTSVIKNVVTHLVRGDEMCLDDLDDFEAPEVPPPSDGTIDDLRMYLESADQPVWLTSAALAYVALAAFPDSVPPAAPAPVAGARPDQALAWPALWFAGQRDLFPREGSDPAKRKRARRIGKVQAHLTATALRCDSIRAAGDV